MQNKILILIFTAIFLQSKLYSQTTEAAIIKDTKVGFRFCTSINVVNKPLYKKLKDGLIQELTSQ